MSDRIILFTHQGKTGGMSFYEVLKANIDHDRIIGDEIDRDFFYGVNKLKNRLIDCISGHYSFGIHRFVQMPDKQPVYVTLMRDPVMRSASYYYYRRGMGEVFDQFADLREWMSSPLRERNDQLWHLCAYDGKIDGDRAFKYLSEDYLAFGLTEYLPESIYMISKALGFQKIFVPWVNKGKRPTEKMDPTEYEEYRQLMLREDPLEMELYERAKALFLERLAALSDADRAAIGQMKADAAARRETTPPMPAVVSPALASEGALADRIETLVEHFATLERTLISQISGVQERLEAVITHQTSSLSNRIEHAEKRVDELDRRAPR